MLSRPLLLISILFVLPGEMMAKPSLEPFPSRESLRELQLQAYGCSRENTTRLCTTTRDLADPLLDHPRLPASCKDALWELLQAAKVSAANSYRRRDSIDRPARRITVVCANPVKPKASGKPTLPSQARLRTSQT